MKKPHNYLLELTRYIHRNPIKLVPNLRDYKWSSYPYYLGLDAKPIECLDKTKSLDMICCNEDVSKYELFVKEERGKESLYKDTKYLPKILGNTEFKKRIFIKE